MEFLALLENFRLGPPLSDIASLIARIILGVTFIYYGHFKWKDLKQNAKDFDEIHGLRPGWLFGTLVAFQEFFGGIFVILGLLTPVFALGFVVHMTSGATWKVTKTDKPFTDWSYDLLALGLSLLLLITGPGAYALDLF
jgi:putative oxidoreductase